MRQHRLVPLATLTWLTLLTACGDATGPGGGNSPLGTWDLVSIDGSALPFVEQFSNYRTEVLSGTITFGTDGRWIMTQTLRLTVGNQQPQTYVNTIDDLWTPSGTTGAVLGDYADDFVTSTASVSGQTLTLREGNLHVLVFRRR